MAETTARTDMGYGLAVFFAIVAILAAVATAIAAYLADVGGSGGLQILSGYAIGASMLAGALAIVALHVYGY